MNTPRATRVPAAMAAVLTILSTTGCERGERPEPVSYKQAREVMGTFAEVTAVAEDQETMSAAVEAAYDALETVNRLMSDYVAESEVGRLNAHPAKKPMVVSEETFAVLLAAREVSERSGGAFDVTVRPLMELWRASAQAGALPEADAMEETLARVGWQKLEVDQAARTITKSVEAMQIDLGAIAKGFALDLAAEAMKEAGAEAGLVSVGGDVLAFGGETVRGNGWTIGVRHPFREGLFRKIAIADEAVATSGVQQRFFEVQGKRYSHIIDPRTGRPAQQAPSVTVIAEDGITADAWATVFSVMSVEEGEKLAADLQGVEVLWIWGSADDQYNTMTPGFGEYVKRAIRSGD